jgi:phage-related protein (TIGR01555 family)
MAFWNRGRQAKQTVDSATSIRSPWIDSLENVLSGMGTGRDKTTGTMFVFTERSPAELDAAYRGDWIARKVVDIPANDATREWRSWQAEKKDITRLEQVEDELDIQRKVRVAMQRGRLYGGGALIIGVDQGNMDQPLVIDSIRKDALKFVHMVTRHEIAAGEMQWDLNDPWYGEPKYYTRSLGNNERLHPSRVVRFLGNVNPSPVSQDPWSDSVLQVLAEAIQQIGTVASGGALMVHESKLDVVKVPDLLKQISSKDYKDRLSNRFALANVAKSIYSLLLLDKEEEWERINANMQGLPDIVKIYLLIASGASDIPATRLLGQSPAGLSATGESDIRNYYDRISSEQRNDLAPALERLDQVLIRSALGTMNESIHYEWNSLWQLTEKERVEVAKGKSEIYKTDVDAGQMPAEVLLSARINQLIEDGTYPGLEQVIEEFEASGESLEPPENPPSPDSPAGAANVEGEPDETGENRAVEDMLQRVRRAHVRDAVVRSLYVRRDVLNVSDLRMWARKQGFELVADPHVTLCYSRAAVDWNKAGEAWGQDEKGRITVAPGGMRAIEKMGSDAVALVISSSALSYRHCDLLERLGARHDYAEYQPHVTVVKTGDVGPELLGRIEPYHGAIVLGPEIFEEIVA